MKNIHLGELLFVESTDGFELVQMAFGRGETYVELVVVNVREFRMSRPASDGVIRSETGLVDKVSVSPCMGGSPLNLWNLTVELDTTINAIFDDLIVRRGHVDELESWGDLNSLPECLATVRDFSFSPLRVGRVVKELSKS